MNSYRDPSTFIDEHHLRLKGLLMPMLSEIDMAFEEIEEVEVVNMSMLSRMNFIGTQNLKTWWTFDAMRPLKKHGFIVKLPDFPVRLGFTVADFDQALMVLQESLGDKLRDKR